MRNEVIATLLVVAILAGAVVGYFVGNNNRETVTTTSVSSTTETFTTIMTQTTVATDLQGTDCSVAVNGSSYYTNPFRVYQIPSATKATVCVAYSFTEPLNYTFSVRLLRNYSNGMQICTPSFCPGISVTASPTYVSVRTPVNLTVAYTITVNSTAIHADYWLGMLSCSVIDVVVGPLPTSFRFGQAYLTSCYYNPNQPSSFEVVGVSNVTVGYVPLT